MATHHNAKGRLSAAFPYPGAMPQMPATRRADLKRVAQ